MSQRNRKPADLSDTELGQLCAEIVEWKDTGLLRGTRLEEFTATQPVPEIRVVEFTVTHEALRRFVRMTTAEVAAR